jgi:hypothetical protein
MTRSKPKKTAQNTNFARSTQNLKDLISTIIPQANNNHHISPIPNNFPFRHKKKPDPEIHLKQGQGQGGKAEGAKARISNSPGLAFTGSSRRPQQPIILLTAKMCSETLLLASHLLPFLLLLALAS